MKINVQSLRRARYVAGALLLGVATTFASVFTPSVSAGTLSARTGTMSNAAASASTVTYQFTFTPTTTDPIKAVVIDFCNDNPTIGGSVCTKPTGMTVGASSIAFSASVGTGGTWTGAVDVGTTRTLTLSNASNAGTTGTAITLSVGGFTNSSVVGTFYARILTYGSTTTGYSSASPGTIGSPIDSGSVAMSTSNSVNVSGTVPETLSFCVSAADLTASTCASATDPVLRLGTGSNPSILNPGQTYNGSVYSKVSTNAANGVTIRMKNVFNTCGGMSRAQNSATCDLPAVGTSPSALTTGAGFGMRAANALSSGGTGSMTIDTPYTHASNFGLDATTGGTTGDNVTGTYGDRVTYSTAPVDAMNTTYTFGVIASNVTPAGLYTAQMSLIAVGSY